MTKSLSSLPQIDVVGASAGTGKTTRLAAEFVQAVEGSDLHPAISPNEIIVCTFTNKAADELSARIRQRLLEDGKVDASQLVLNGYVGTVNAICGRLLREYAFDCGLSPRQDVVPEQMQQNLFSTAVANVLDAYSEEIDSIAHRLSFNEYGRQGRFQKRSHWMDHVHTICTLARANALSADDLKASAERSWQGVQRHLGKLEGSLDPEELDRLLESGIEHAINNIDVSNDSTGKTAAGLQLLRECHSRARTGSLTWRDWAALKKIEVGKESKNAVTDIAAVCAILQHHPRLHADLKEYISLVFDCASASLRAYQDYKKAHGLVDFVDQEYLALELLDVPAVQASIRSRFRLALIDEFQDTSPIQLALFLKLAKLIDRSIWVGDIKQAIYGFRGTDPQLMQEAAKQFNRRPPLEFSYRSRPELVHLSNELFRRVFSAYGIAEDDVVIRPSGKRAAASATTLELWNCSGTGLTECFQSVALGVSELLQRPEPLLVEDPKSRESRPLRGSDIAILCRKNEHCAGVARALADRNLKVAMTRDGLLDTPECLLTLSVLRYLADPSDRVALARIVHLSRDHTMSENAEYGRTTQSRWLAEWLASGRNPETLLSNRANFDVARAKLPGCTAGDAILLSITAGGIIEMIEGWGRVTQRMSNLDALRGLAIEYEDTCAMAHMPATIQGFLSYVEHLDDAEQPASVDADAIQVLTYHGSKGLEWPIVILADLDAEAAPKVHKDLCKIYVESTDMPFDVSDPLDGRWIRFWPWPFGSIEKDGFFESNAANSPEFASTARRARSENARLMYVGFTRARDFLILAPYTGRKKNVSGLQWLDELATEDGPILRLPRISDDGEIAAEPTVVAIGDLTHRLNVLSFKSEEVPVLPKPETTSFAPKRPSVDHSTPPTLTPYTVLPSNLSIATSLSVVAVDKIGERIAIASISNMETLGECIHTFLGADDVQLSRDARLDSARRVLRLWGMHEQIRDEDLLIMSERLHVYLQSHFGDYIVRRECPVTSKVGHQRLRGVIDLLLETQTEYHVIDHKSFPGAEDVWKERAQSYAPQLEAYRLALQEAGSKPVGKLMIHMPIVGRIIHLQ